MADDVAVSQNSGEEQNLEFKRTYSIDEFKAAQGTNELRVHPSKSNTNARWFTCNNARGPVSEKTDLSLGKSRLGISLCLDKTTGEELLMLHNTAEIIAVL